MLHSVYFRSLVDLENKSCVRVPLVIILPECRELNHCCRDGLKKPFKWFVSSFTRLGGKRGAGVPGYGVQGPSCHSQSTKVLEKKQNQQNI